MRKPVLMTVLFLSFASVLGGAGIARADVPQTFCDSQCSEQSWALWNEFTQSRGIDPSRLPAVYSGGCYFTSSMFDPAQLQYATAVFDRFEDGFVYGGDFSFFYSEKYDALHEIKIYPDRADADLNPGKIPIWLYWFRQNAEGQLLVAGEWGTEVRILCKMDRVPDGPVTR
jgi:hypothetical protein